MVLGGLGLVHDGKQEDARWFLWCVVSKEAEEELGLCPSSSLTDIVKNNNKNHKIHCNKLPGRGVSSEAELPLGCWEPEQPLASAAGHACCRAPVARRSPGRRRQMCGLSLPAACVSRLRGWCWQQRSFPVYPRWKYSKGRTCLPPAHA